MKKTKKAKTAARASVPKQRRARTAKAAKPKQGPAMRKVPSNATGAGRSNRDWWPNQLNLKMLHQHSALSNPMGGSFNYAEAFKQLDLQALKKDLYALMTDSPLRAALHPHGVAQRRHVSRRRRSRRRRQGRSALRAA
jgi:hypothetical protein